MPASDSRWTGYLKLGLTGLISLIVGVASGLILNFATSPKAGLEYEVITSEVFSGPITNTAILAIVVRNTGTRELEDVIARIDLENAELREHRIVGLPPSAYSESAGHASLVIDVPYFNPDESTSIQLLVELNSTNFDSPSIDVRAKGVTGKKREDSGDERTANILLATVTAAGMALLPAMMVFLVFWRRQMGEIRPFGYTTSHLGDQREVLAYVLSINGMHEEADLARRSGRELSYWSHADLVTERCLQTNEEGRIRQGIKALKDLMHYAQVSETSCMLINFDIARMAASVNDDETAAEHLKASLIGNHEVIKKRIKFDERLQTLAETVT